MLTGVVGEPPVEVRAQPAPRPNIVLIFPDNLGWGEVGAYGSVRGPLTPRIDKMAAEGIRLNNFNVEFSCTVSRAALMTGRYAIRSGATQPGGITLWEVTIAEALKSVGYATGALRQVASRRRSARGPRAVARRASTSSTASRAPATRRRRPSRRDRRRRARRSSGKARPGEPARNVKPFDMETRRTIDREAAERGIAFMERQARERRPFFFYYPMTQIHFPTLAHPDFAGKTRRRRRRRRDGRDGRQRRPRARRHRRLGITRNTIVLWCTDNGPEQRRPWRGSPGPWSGFYNSVMEGGIRTPCIIRWPGRIPGRPGLERDRPRDRSLPDARRRRRRRHRAEGSRDRRRQPAAVPRRQAADARTAITCSSSPTRSCAP